MNHSKNILQVTNLFRSAKNFIGSQFSYLQERGYNMHLICSPADGLKDFAAKQNIQYEAMILSRQVSIFSDLKALVGICRYIKKNKIDTIIGHQAKGRLISVIAGKIMRVPNVIIFAHGTIFETSTGFKRKFLIWESKFESMCANKVVCVSKFVAKIRQENHIDKKEKQIILGKGTCGGIDTQIKFNPDVIQKHEQLALLKKIGLDDEDLVIGFCGRIVRDKGITELVDAFNLFKIKHPRSQIKLLLVGDFEKRDSISNEYKKYIIENPDIILTGFVKEKIELYYSIMSLLILPSYRDGFGMSVIEASAMGIPVLASDITGCAETLKTGETGYHVDITADGICEGIEKLYTPILREQFGKQGREWVVLNFDHSVVWPYIEKLLEDE